MTDEPFMAVEDTLALEEQAAPARESHDPSSVAEDREGAGTSAPPRRRRRRRGRGRSRGPGRPAGAGSADGPDGEEVPEAGEQRRSPFLDGPIPTTDFLPPREPGSRTRRRRRRGGRGRRKPSDGAPSGTTDAERTAEAAGTPDAARTVETNGATETEGAENATGRAPRRRRTSPAASRRSTGEGSGGDSPGEVSDAGQTPEEEGAEAAPSRRRRGSSRAAGTTRTRTGSRGKREESEGAPTRLSSRSSRSGSRRREIAPPVERVRNKTMIITEHGERDQIAVLEERELVQHFITRMGAHSLVGNIFMARVQTVLPGMEAAFLDIGRGRNAVLYAGEVNYDEDIGSGPPPRIEQVLKTGQAVMVQVTKDPFGGKGARLTAQVSLPGRFVVLVPNSSLFGISRRLPDNERRRLRTAVKKVKPDEHGVIVRTAAEGATEEELRADIERLTITWTAIEKGSNKAKAPSLVYEEPELTLRVVRDLFNAEEFLEVVTDSERIYERVTGYLRDVAPDLAELVKLRTGPLSVLEEFHVDEQIHKALSRKVWLPSGGYLVIDRTEALTVIDVNTGKHVGKTNLEETVVKTNLEAAKEVARQLRLRDIGGMIIIDFIDMLLEQNKKSVVDTVKESLAQDKTRSQVFDISPLGLLEVTRKRVSAGLLESFSETCPTCEGRGILLTHEI